MIKKKLYYEKTETGYIIYVKYSLLGISIYIKEKTVIKGDPIIDYDAL